MFLSIFLMRIPACMWSSCQNDSLIFKNLEMGTVYKSADSCHLNHGLSDSYFQSCWTILYFQEITNMTSFVVVVESWISTFFCGIQTAWKHCFINEWRIDGQFHLTELETFNDSCSWWTNEWVNMPAGNTVYFSYLDPKEKALEFFQCKKKNLNKSVW